MRRFENHEQFWEMWCHDSAYTVRWGPLGTPGAERTQPTESPQEAKAALERLTWDLLDLSYREIGSAMRTTEQLAWNPDFEAALLADPSDEKTLLVYSDWLQAHDNPLGELISAQHRGQKGDELIEENFRSWFGLDAVKLLRKQQLRLTWKNGFVERLWCGRGPPARAQTVLRAFLASPVARLMRELAVGMPDETYLAQPLLECLIERPPRRLERLLVVDFDHRFELSMSQVSIGDVSRLWSAVPSLREVTFRGGGALELGDLHAPELRSFTIETNGLPTGVLSSVLRAQWPRLQRLVLWLGTDELGGQVTIAALQPLLGGVGLGPLEHLGLVNYQHANELISALASSKLLRQLETLDLSLGTLDEAGAAALEKNAAAFAHLKRIDLSQNQLDPDAVARLGRLSLALDLSHQRPGSSRYVAVGE